MRAVNACRAGLPFSAPLAAAHPRKTAGCFRGAAAWRQRRVRTSLIERVTYHNPENGFAVLKVVVKGRHELATVVGSATSVSAGEHLR